MAATQAGMVGAVATPAVMPAQQRELPSAAVAKPGSLHPLTQYLPSPQASDCHVKVLVQQHHRWQLANQPGRGPGNSAANAAPGPLFGAPAAADWW